MARNGMTVVTSKAEPNDLYDSLSQDAKDIWDEIGSLGYTPEKGKAGLWFARKTGDAANDAIGPADSLAVLYSQVKADLPEDYFEAADNVIDLDDLPPSDRLPGMEEPAIEELDRQADNCIAELERKKKAAAASKDADDLMREMMRKHGRKRYARRGWSLVDEESHKLVIKPADQPKKKKESALAA